MKTARVKYGLMVAGRMVYKGTEVEVLDAESDRVQKVWPGIQDRMTSQAVVVQFSHLSFPTLAHIDELEFN